MTHARNAEDFQIIDLILAGDQRQYARLVDRYKSLVNTITFRIIGVRQEAEEAAQDAFVKAYHHLTQFNREARFSTWLYRIAFNTAISYKRKHKQRMEDLTRVSAHSPFNSADSVERQDKKKFIDQAIRKLPEADRIAVTLYYMEELSLDEIANITGMLPNTAKVRIHRARLKLADELTSLLKEESFTL